MHHLKRPQETSYVAAIANSKILFDSRLLGGFRDYDDLALLAIHHKVDTDVLRAILRYIPFEGDTSVHKISIAQESSRIQGLIEREFPHLCMSTRDKTKHLAYSGDILSIQRVRDKQSSYCIDEMVVRVAASNGNIRALTWMLYNSFHIPESAVLCAIERNVPVSVVQHLFLSWHKSHPHRNRSHMAERVSLVAAEHGMVEWLYWAYDNGFRYFSRTLLHGFLRYGIGSNGLCVQDNTRLERVLEGVRWMYDKKIYYTTEGIGEFTGMPRADDILSILLPDWTRKQRYTFFLAEDSRKIHRISKICTIACMYEQWDIVKECRYIHAQSGISFVHPSFLKPVQKAYFEYKVPLYAPDELVAASVEYITDEHVMYTAKSYTEEEAWRAFDWVHDIYPISSERCTRACLYPTRLFTEWMVAHKIQVSRHLLSIAVLENYAWIVPMFSEQLDSSMYIRGIKYGCINTIIAMYEHNVPLPARDELYSVFMRYDANPLSLLLMVRFGTCLSAHTLLESESVPVCVWANARVQFLYDLTFHAVLDECG